MTTGTVTPRASLVLSLNWETKPPMLTPCWPRAGPTGVADAAGFAEQVENPIIVFDVDHQITRIALAFLDDALAVAHLGDPLDRNDDLPEVVAEALDLDAALDGVLDGLFAAALDLDDIPF